MKLRKKEIKVPKNLFSTEESFDFLDSSIGELILYHAPPLHLLIESTLRGSMSYNLTKICTFASGQLALRGSYQVLARLI